METLLILLVLAIPFGALAGLILAILALRRQKSIRDRLELLEMMEHDAPDRAWKGRISELESRLEGLEALAWKRGTEEPVKVPTPVVEPSRAQEDSGPPSIPAVPPAPPSIGQRTIRPQIPIVMPDSPGFVSDESEVGSEVEKTVSEAAVSPRPKFRIDIEEWVGVRGAAAAGGVILALAALLFFQYSIQHGLITPLMRVVSGLVVGLAALGISEFLISRGQRSASNALAGAGVVILYASTWAAENLYGLIGALPAFVLMLVITSVCITLAIARSSAFIAILGLVGGFATPLLIAAEAAGPVPLFVYILVLDLALLWLAKLRRWPWLAVFCLLGTALHQALWILRTMTAERVILSMGILLVFSVVFLFLGPSREESGGRLGKLTRVAAIALPFFFGFHYASTFRLDVGVTALGMFLIILSFGAGYLARKEYPFSVIGAAVASSLLVGLRVVDRRLTWIEAWQLVGVMIGLAAVFVFWEILERRQGGTGYAVWAAGISILSSEAMLVLLPAERHIIQPWPWVLAWVSLGAGLILLAHRKKWAALIIPAGVFPALGLGVAAALHSGSSRGLTAPGFAALVLAIPLTLSILSLLLKKDAPRYWADISVVLTVFAMIPASLVLAESFRPVSLLLCLGLTLLSGVLAVVSATRILSGGLFLGASLGGALAQTLIFELARGARSGPSESIEAFGLLAGTTLLFVFWPALAGGAFEDRRSAWWGASVASFAFFPVLHRAFITAFGKDFIAVLPLILGACCLVVFNRARKAMAVGSRGRRSAETWYLAASLCLVSLAIPLQLHREWLTIGWALNASAMIYLWKRLDHPGLKYLASLLFAAVAVRLLLNPSILSYHHPNSIPLINWLSYTYLIPAFALLWSRKILGELEIARRRSWEFSLPGGKRPILGVIYGLGALLIIFAWINLSIADYFSRGQSIILDLQRLPARDLTTSVAWAGYAVVLLIIGVRIRSASLRWVSLGLMLLTLSKVFLHDLGRLEDLYRVASLVGLAISLILVSLIYQRFVFSNKARKTE